MEHWGSCFDAMSAFVINMPTAIIHGEEAFDREFEGVIHAQLITISTTPLIMMINYFIIGIGRISTTEKRSGGRSAN